MGNLHSCYDTQDNIINITHNLLKSQMDIQERFKKAMDVVSYLFIASRKGLDTVNITYRASEQELVP